MKIKELEEALNEVDGFGCDESVEVIIIAAKIMLELMKARQGATGGEWFQSNCNRIHGEKNYLIASNLDAVDKEFITLAANLTRETGKS